MLSITTHEDVVCVKVTLKPNGPASVVHVYLTDGMLVDTGPQIAEAELTAFYPTVSFDSVVLTHSHEDHVGTAAWISSHLHVPLYIHPKGIPLCTAPAEYPKYRQDAWWVREAFSALPLGETFSSRSSRWKVLETPGHAEDHIALLDEETGRLFAGDLFLGPKTAVILRSESIPQQIASLRAVLACPFQSVYCGHAGYLAQGRERLSEKLAYLEHVSGEILRLHQMGCQPVEINHRLFERVHPLTVISEGEFDSLHIVRSVVESMEGTRGYLPS